MMKLELFDSDQLRRLTKMKITKLSLSYTFVTRLILIQLNQKLPMLQQLQQRHLQQVFFQK